MTITLTKPATEYGCEERREIYARLCREALSSFTPSMGSRFSGKQVDAAKAKAWKIMQKAGL
jgi:hypothetical protein